MATPSITETRRRDQWEPLLETEALRVSLIGRKMCVVRVKLGRAPLMVKGSGVCMSMKAIEGRRRMMRAAGYLGSSSSRSRYLGS